MRHPFLRTLAGAVTPATTDPNFENVTLLLHGDGTNGGQNNTFLDSSSNNFTITRNGNPMQGTFSPYGDNWSNYFDTSNTSLIANGTTSSGNFPTGTDFTIEFWWRSKLVNSGTGPIIAKHLFQGNSNDAWLVSMTGAYKLTFEGQGSGSSFTPVTSTTAIMDCKWHHCAISRSGTTYRIFIDGVLEQTATNSTVMNQGTHNITFPGVTTIVGQNYAALGFISNLRIVKGTCLYTSTFTPSATPLTAVTNTLLLTCQSNRFLDNGPNAYSIGIQQANFGRPSVQRFSPLSPSTAYSSGTTGGAGYFDGDDYLSAPAGSSFAYGTGNFTVEGWFYATKDPVQYGSTLFAQTVGGTNYFWCILGDGSASSPNPRKISFIFATSGGGTTITSGATGFERNTWNHFAIVRNSSSVTVYLNGVGGTAATCSQDFTNTTYAPTIGRYTHSASNYFTGYLSQLRVVKGTAVYTANFTPPTAALTAISGTSLLLNFTNSAIIDNSMLAVIDTAGNAQIDTTTKKFGTGSLEFDGTGDWLIIPDTSDPDHGGVWDGNRQLRTGNFTIECWLYLSATGTARGIVGKGTSTTGWLLSTNTSNAVVFTYGTSTITSTGTLSGSTWYHLAVVREGTGTNQTKIYINGTNDGTGTVSTDFSQTNAMYVGANRTGGDAMNGYIDDLRITNGVARYTANFTAPTAAFPDL